MEGLMSNFELLKGLAQIGLAVLCVFGAAYCAVAFYAAWKSSGH
jgi:hypothetical protein